MRGCARSPLEAQGRTVVAVDRPAPGYAVVRFEGRMESLPGQFAMLRVPPSSGGFLPRPMSILDPGPPLAFLVREVGAGSRALAALEPGDRLELVGPLGQPFPPSTGSAPDVLVAGGVGVAPIIAHARLTAQSSRRPHAIYGGATAGALVLADELASLARLVEVTQDGSTGVKGLATDPLPGILAAEPGARVLACGPIPMMAAAAREALRAGAQCLVCMEALMACGFGACLGCAVPARAGGYLYVCSDGPVIDASFIDWDALPDTAEMH